MRVLLTGATGFLGGHLLDALRGEGARVAALVRSADAAEGAFLRAVGEAACEDFTTVIGPGGDAAHQDHLHMDLARHSKGRHVCRGGDEPVPQGGRMFSFFQDRSIERTGSIGGDDEEPEDTGEDDSIGH